MEAVGEFFHHPLDNTWHALHELSRQKNENISKDGFEVSLDVSHFQPAEVRVKTVDTTIIVEAKHAERDDGHGPVERHLIQKYILPKEYDMSKIHAALSSNGVLTIIVPVPKINISQEQYVPIVYTNVLANLIITDKQGL